MDLVMLAARIISAEARFMRLTPEEVAARLDIRAVSDHVELLNRLTGGTRFLYPAA
jgi:hypothetical protein